MKTLIVFLFVTCAAQAQMFTTLDLFTSDMCAPANLSIADSIRNCTYAKKLNKYEVVRFNGFAANFTVGRYRWRYSQGTSYLQIEVTVVCGTHEKAIAERAKMLDTMKAIAAEEEDRGDSGMMYRNSKDCDDKVMVWVYPADKTVFRMIRYIQPNYYSSTR